ncbi:replication-relaxation family protein [Cohnella sp. AR92]|uniref:replication-relaxation family protein n=1 Tax=Cohnella sp. AR92 TaxID=648716 RepID=UPI000F8C9724|nr:replication-relaxation family protein [Cohnella sp. AR92]RUS44951.1 hypothetical protein ELR57_22100 [Cohnella sp. AR92]
MTEVRHFVGDEFDLGDYDPTESFSPTDGMRVNGVTDILEDEESDDDLLDEELEDENASVSTPELREKSGRRKRWVSGKSSRLKSGHDEDKVIKLCLKNENKMSILRCLYVHRQLDMFQISRLAVPHMHKKSVGNLLAEMYGQNLLSRDLSFKTWRTKGDEKKYHYRLARLGLYIIAVFDMQALWVYDHLNEPKQHYMLKNLAIGSQERHHFETQDFVSRLLRNLADRGIHPPSTEWRRYPIEDPSVAGKSAYYRPDWFIFKPNAYYTSLVEEKRTSECPLHTPVESRSSKELDLLKQHFKGLLSVECDLKTEDLKEIEDKCKKFLYSLDYYPSNSMAFFSINEWYENDTLLPSSKIHNQKRGRNTKKVIIRQLEDALIHDRTNVLHGDELTCRQSCEIFIEQEGNMLAGFTRGEAFAAYVNAAPSVLDYELIPFTEELKNVSVTPPMPVFPDEVVRVRRFGEAETHMIFFARIGWVNQVAKALAMQRWIDEGNQKAKVVIVYPNDEEMSNDVHLLETQAQLHYMNWQDVLRTGAWGHYKKPTYRKVRGQLTLVWEEADR